MGREYECTSATIHLGDETWHDGPGWYYLDDEYPDEGSVGAFATREEAEAHAKQCGYLMTPMDCNEYHAAAQAIVSEGTCATPGPAAEIARGLTTTARPWPDFGLWIGECPECGSTLTIGSGFVK